MTTCGHTECADEHGHIDECDFDRDDSPPDDDGDPGPTDDACCPGFRSETGPTGAIVETHDRDCPTAAVMFARKRDPNDDGVW